MGIKKILYEEVTGFGGIVFYIFVLFLLFYFGQYNLLKYLSLSLAFVMILSSAIKLYYPKERPNKQKAESFIMRIDASSFPSVHTMRVVSLMFWFSIYFREKIFIASITVFGLLVMYSRIYLKKHYLSDVAGGIVMSLLINGLIWWLI